MNLVPASNFTQWRFAVHPLLPTEAMRLHLERLQVFDLTGSEAGKLLLVDAVIAEGLSRHPKLKAWKGRPLESDTLTGFADYLVSERLAFLRSPFLCVVEAKKDDFEQGEIQCVAEMVACRWNNLQVGSLLTVYGIVSNGTAWQFYAITLLNEVLQSDQYATGSLPELLGVVDYVFGECAKNVSL